MSIPTNSNSPTELVIIALGTNILLCYPISFYVFWLLYKHWDSIYFIKRRRLITLLLVIIVSFCSLIITQLICWEELYFETYYANLISLYLFSCYIFSHSILYITRIWCLYYDHEVHAIGEHKLWHSVINNNHFINNWFIKNKLKYGNEKWILLYINIPIFILCSSIFIIFQFIQIIGIIWFFSIIIGLLIWRKYPKIHDTQLIRKEFKIYLIINIISILLTAATDVILTKYYIKYVFIIIIIINITNCFCLYVLVIFPIKYVQITVIDINTQNNDKEASLSSKTRSRIQTRTQTLSKVRKTTKDESQRTVTVSGSSAGGSLSKYKSWIDYINESNMEMENYSNFMKFLGREFCVESLLFITEYLQLKRFIINDTDILNTKSDKIVFGRCDKIALPKLSDQFPVSFIVKEFENSIKNDRNNQNIQIYFMKSVKRLYLKYIQSRLAAYEINIASHIRKSIKISIYGNDRTTISNDNNDKNDTNWAKMSAGNLANLQLETVNSLSVGHQIDQNDNDNVFEDKVIEILKAFQIATEEVTLLLMSSFYKFRCLQIAPVEV